MNADKNAGVILSEAKDLDRAISRNSSLRPE